MFDREITLFNLHGERWYTTLFTGVQMNAVSSKTATTHGQNNGDTVEIIISMPCDGLSYMGPKAYAVLPDPTGYFTFAPESSFIVVGDHMENAPLNDDDYEQGLYHEMNMTLDEVYMVTSATYYSLIPHFEIGGR